jgi:hypothetical protein
VLVACAALMVGCNGAHPFDAGAPDDATAADAFYDCPFCTDATYDVPQLGPPDALPPPDEPCDDAGACALPRSICANGEWLEYFDNGTCVDGGCTFDAKMVQCGWGCWDGGCGSRPPSTDPAP